MLSSDWQCPIFGREIHVAKLVRLPKARKKEGWGPERGVTRKVWKLTRGWRAVRRWWRSWGVGPRRGRAGSIRWRPRRRGIDSESGLPPRSRNRFHRDSMKFERLAPFSTLFHASLASQHFLYCTRFTSIIPNLLIRPSLNTSHISNLGFIA